MRTYISLPFLVLVDALKALAAQDLQSELNVNILRRKLLGESSNLEARPTSMGSTQVWNALVTRSSGTFPAVPNGNTTRQPSPSTPPQESDNTQNHPKSDSSWKYIVIIASSVAVFCLVALAICIVCQRKGAKTIAPWKTGISGQLQKAFVTGTF